MIKNKGKWIALTLVVFVILDVVNGNTYSIMNVESMVYLSVFVLIIAGILFLNKENYKKFFGTFGIILTAFLITFIIGGFMSSKLFNAKRFANVIGDVQEVDYAQLYGNDREIEMSYVDKDSAIIAADKKLGELSDASSRFRIDYEEFSQINYNGNMVRVAPLEYSDTFKKYTNLGAGVPYYVMVTTGDGAVNAKAELITLPEPMQYYPGAPFFKDLHRHVSINHKFSYLDDYYFEVDNQGHPYWIVQVITKRVGIWGAKDMAALITVDAVSGETKRYGLEDAPEWVDSIYPTDMLMNQAKDYYTLSGGFINSMTQQRGVMAIDSVEGAYNYVMIDGEIYIFTGIRPIALESSSTTGMLFMNKRTGQAIELELPGVSIPSAEMTSIGSIQEKGYIPTTPVLMNIGGFPTYVMSLKDVSGVVRGFSYVNYQDYTKSSVGDTVAQTEKNYLNIMGDSESLAPEDHDKGEGVIEDIVPIITDGNTVYLIRMVGDETIYSAPISVNDLLAFIKPNDIVIFEYSGNRIYEIDKKPVVTPS